MTDPGDEKLSRRYRELAREEPPAHADAAILAAARGRTPVSREASRAGSGVRPRFSTWMGPVSIAAVLVLGIGVSLRMQMEQPGVETSAPPPSVSEYSMPAEPLPQEESKPAAPREEPKPAPPPAAKPERPAAKALVKRLDAPAPQARRREAEAPSLADAPVVIRQAPVPASPPASPPATMRAAPAQITAPAAAPAPAPEAAPPPPVGASAGRAAQSAPLRAKREGFAADNAATESRRIAAAADPDPNRELERIALLREAGRHAEADRALEELRRRHPGFRIPDAVWERVKPR